MHFLSRPRGSRIVALIEGESSVRDDDGVETKISRRAGCRLDRVVCSNTYDHDVANVSHSQPAFESCIYESIRYVLFDDVLVVTRGELVLELSARLTRPKYRIG